MMNLYGESSEGFQGFGDGGRVVLLIATRTHQTRPSETPKTCYKERIIYE